MKGLFLSPEGQSMLARQPDAMAHLMPFAQQMQQDFMPRIQKLMEEAKAAK